MAWQDQAKKNVTTTSFLYLVFANYLLHDPTAAFFLTHRHPWPSLGTSTICSQTTARIGRCFDVPAHHRPAPIDGRVAAPWRWCSTGFGHVCGCGLPAWVAVLPGKDKTYFLISNQLINPAFVAFEFAGQINTSSCSLFAFEQVNT